MKFIKYIIPILLVSCNSSMLKYGATDPGIDEIIGESPGEWEVIEGEKEMEIYKHERVKVQDEEELVNQLENEIEHIKKLLNSYEYDSTVHLFLLPDEEIRDKFFGKTGNKERFYSRQIIYMTYEPSQSYKSELIKLILVNKWGSPGYTWLMEGYAEHLQSNDRYHVIAREYSTQKAEITSFLNAEVLSEKEKMLAASFVSYLSENYSETLMESIWKSEKLIEGSTLEEWILEWQNFLKE